MSAWDIPGGGPLLVLRIVLDESGHRADPQCPVMAMAGAIASRDAWDTASEQWQGVLDRFEINDGLHMNEFAHSTGEFKTWKGDERKRRDFINDLLRASEPVQNYIGASIDCKQWESLPLKELLKDPYFQCFQYCCTGAAGLATLWPEGGLIPPSIQLVVALRPDTGAIENGLTHDFYLRIKDEMNSPNHDGQDIANLRQGDRLSGIAFQEPKTFIGLQLADLVAYELSREHLRLKGVRQYDKPRYPFQQICQRRCYFKYFD